MKYPVLRTRFLPNLYKHCKKVQVLHVSYEDRGFLSQDEQRGIWLQDTREKLYEQIEGNFTTCQATRIFSLHKETFIIFKDNLTKKLLIEFLENLLTEISYYCEEQVQFRYQLLTAVLFQDGCEPRMTMANKLGRDIEDSDEIKQSTVLLKPGRPPRGKYFKSWKDYEKQINERKAVHSPIEKPLPQKEAPVDTGDYMYYI